MNLPEANSYVEKLKSMTLEAVLDEYKSNLMQAQYLFSLDLDDPGFARKAGMCEDVLRKKLKALDDEHERQV